MSIKQSYDTVYDALLYILIKKIQFFNVLGTI